MPTVLKRPEAERDLLEIWLYIAGDSIENADRFLDKLEQQCHSLGGQPQMGHDRGDLMPGLRSFPVGNYLIFYQAIDDGIDVIRVLHGGRYLPVLF